jgi:cytochrome c oxidase cbb3-type subunit 1
MWNSGIIQGLMWRTYNDSGTLAYSFVVIWEPSS